VNGVAGRYCWLRAVRSRSVLYSEHEYIFLTREVVHKVWEFNYSAPFSLLVVRMRGDMLRLVPEPTWTMRQRMNAEHTLTPILELQVRYVASGVGTPHPSFSAGIPWSVSLRGEGRAICKKKAA
jgi:hypothetical protein